MKKLLTCLAVAGAAFGLAPAANAQQSEIFLLGSSTDYGDPFAMGSYRYTFGSNGTANNGFAVGLSVRTLEYSNGVTDVTVTSQRASVGYRFTAIENSVTTVMVGFENVSSSGETGGFVSLEHWNGMANGDSLFLLAEYASANDETYFSANYSFGFDGFSVGPTVSYLTLPDYRATDFGVQANVSLGSSVSVLPSVTFRSFEAGPNPTDTAVVGAIGLYMSF